MAEMLPSSSPAPTAPAFDPKALVDSFIAVLTKPADFFASPAIKEQKGFGPPLIFAVAMGLVAGVIGALITILHLGVAGGMMGGALGVGAGILKIIVTPIFAVIAAFVGGAIVHVIALIGGGKSTYETSVRIACYAMAVYPVAALLEIFPFLPTLAHLYGLYLVALGVIALHAANRQTTFIVCGILAAIALVMGIVSWIATRALMAGVGAGAEAMRRAAEAAQQK